MAPSDWRIPPRPSGRGINRVLVRPGLPTPRPSHTTGRAFYAPGGSSESLNPKSAKIRFLSFTASHSWRPFDTGDDIQLPLVSGTSRSFLPSMRLVQDGKPCFLVQRFGPSSDSSKYCGLG